MNGRSTVVISLVLLLILTSSSPLSVASSHGIDGYSASGCSCHSTTESEVEVTLSGVPTVYIPGKIYRLTISLNGEPEPSESGHRGGFNLKASFGKLSVPYGADDIQISKEGESRHSMGGGQSDTWETTGEATHTHSGANQREWDVNWKAPSPGVGDVRFTLAGNIVDGDHETSGDQWALASYDSVEGKRTLLDLLAQYFIHIAIVGSIGLIYTFWRKGMFE